MDADWHCEWNHFSGDVLVWVRPNDGSGPFTLREAVNTLRQWPETLQVGKHPDRPLLFRLVNDTTKQTIILRHPGVGG